MKKICLNLFYFFVYSNYMFFIFGGVLLLPFVILLKGFYGVYEIYYEDDEYSYQSFKIHQQQFKNYKKMRTE